MRTLLSLLALCAIAITYAACDTAPTATTQATLGTTTIEQMMTNTGYKAWYDPGYSAYPAAADQAQFDSSVAEIRSAFDPAAHQVVMVIKPNCGCQITQLWMPRVVKALDAAGVPHANLDVFITDSHLDGVDTLEQRYNTDITTAPVFMVVKNSKVETTIDPVTLASGQTIEQALAAAFAKP